MAQNALLEGREAAERRAWRQALDLLHTADAHDELGPDDLMLLADSLWWLGRMRDCVGARERAHAGYLARGNNRRAAFAAIKLADHHADLAELGVATAWLQKATSMLEHEEEGVEHGWLAMQRTSFAAKRGDGEAVVREAREARRFGEKYGDKDVIALSLAAEGATLVHMGEIDAGIALLEESTVPAVTNELSPYATGWVFCIVISATSAIADWQRAGQWTEAAKRWCDRQAISGFPGVCRVHRAEIMRLRGALADAEVEARTATEELGSFNISIAASAFKELGEIRLRSGDLDGAEEAFRQANELGVLPQPGLALIQFMRGRTDAAASSLKRALADENLDRLARAKILPTAVEVAIAVADVETARAAVAELNATAEDFGSSALRACAATASARLKLVEKDLAGAEIDAKRAGRLWKECDVLYEAALVGLLLGDIYLAQGDREAGAFEYATALSTFERFGALPDAEVARARLAGAADAPEPAGRRVAKTFLFSDIVRSTNLVEAIGDDAWTDLLKWHDEMMRARFREHGGEEVVHTGDGFFIAFETADHAMACAIAIQRTLAEHRRVHGFAPQVRIGVHVAEAAEVEGNYHGKGVHEAARIGALAEGGEILASEATLDCLGRPVGTAEVREVPLKGVSQPVRIASVDWRAD